MTALRVFVPLSVVCLAGCALEERLLLQNYDPGEDELVEPTVVDLDAEGWAPEVDGDTFVFDLGPSDLGTGRMSGATFTFEGTGERHCLILDPQSVLHDDLRLNSTGGEQANPYFDNFPHDDGDIDLLAGPAAYYSGTPGTTMGDFIADVPDDNGILRRIDLNLCLMQDYFGQAGGAAGRASPEWCSFETQLGVPYRVAMTVFSVPVDDDLLRFAFELRTGDCPGTVNECTLRGDADEAPTALPYDSDDVEEMFCKDFEG